VVASLSPRDGTNTGGTSVTISGTNFTGTTTVQFGNNAATSFTVNSPTQITAVAPAGSDKVSVTVTTWNGTSNSLQFKYFKLEHFRFKYLHFVR
jgi:hypothetical protein